MTQRKYTKGDVIKSMDVLIECLDRDGVVYMNQKVQNRGWIISMDLRSVLCFLKNGGIRKVEKVEHKNIGKCKIFGVESQSDFSKIISEKDVDKECKDIWNNPSKYSKFKDGSEDAYYKFTKLLWVKFSDGHEERLCEIAEGGVN